MLEKPDQRLRQREQLLKVSRAITAQLDLTSVLDLVIDVAVDLLAGTAGLIALRDEDGSMRVGAAPGLPREIWPAFNALLITPLEDRHALAQRLQEVAFDTRLPLRQVIALPLVFRQTRVGVIYVFRAALNVAFTQEEQDLLKAFADQAAIAVSNARLYQSVLHEKQQLDALIEQSADGVMILDSRWRITTFNRAMERLTGWPREEAIGHPCAEVLAIHSAQGVNICLVDCPLQRHPPDPNPTVEGWITARDGRQLYVRSNYAVQRGPGGEFQGALANVRDVTEQKIEEFYGIKQLGNEVIFSAHFEQASQVLIAGDFNGWNPVSPLLLVSWQSTLRSAKLPTNERGFVSNTDTVVSSPKHSSSENVDSPTLRVPLGSIGWLTPVNWCQWLPSRKR